MEMLMRLIALLVLAIAPALAAADSGFYVFIDAARVSSGGTVSAREHDAELASAGFSVQSSRERSRDLAIGIGLGYRLAKHLAIEGSYRNLGSVHHYEASFTSGANLGLQTKDWKAKSFQLAAIGLVPLAGDLSLVAKGALALIDAQHRTETQIRTPAGAIVSTTDETTEESKLLPVLGLGVAYQIAPTVHARLMYEYMRPKSGMYGPGNDLARIQSLAFGFGVHF